MSTILELSQLTIKAEDRLLSSASLSVNPTDRIAIFGPGGSGKSLLLKYVNDIQESNLTYECRSFEKEEGRVYFKDYNHRKQEEMLQPPSLEYDLYLIDEPENGHDLNTFADFSKNIKKSEGTLMFVTHNLEFLREAADKILVLKYGEQVGIYTNESFFNNTDPYIDYLSKMGC